ncbi:hypothetical protein B0H19DRAFT_1109091 [Mycena capillaripes]|nr:hypothetical protein B0H19DRAFT_1109091 [Mycena capillaripes]
MSTTENIGNGAQSNTASDSALAQGITDSRAQKSRKLRRNPLLVDPLSPLSLDICARFPIELYECIIDQLCDDKCTLTTCSLVCRAWCAPSRFHLFQNATTIRVHRQNSQLFFELLASQRLNSSIGRLHLDSDEDPDERPREPFKLNNHLHCFTVLPRLKYLHLSNHYDRAHPNFFAALSLPHIFPNVTDLELTCIRFKSFVEFVRVLHTLPLLRRIAIDRVWCGANARDRSWYTTDGRESKTYPVLGKFEDVVADCSDMVQALFWLPFQPYVRRLAILIEDLRPEHTVMSSNVLRALGPGLEHLILHDADNTHTFDLSQSSGVHTFEITGIKCLAYNTRADNEWVTALLAQCGTPRLGPHREDPGRVEFSAPSRDIPFNAQELGSEGHCRAPAAADVCFVRRTMGGPLSIFAQHIRSASPRFLPKMVIQCSFHLPAVSFPIYIYN